MHRLFLDANVLFSAAYRSRAGLRRLWQLRPAVELVSSPYAIEEARRNLEDPAARARLDSLVKGLRIVPDLAGAPLPPDIELPEKDQPILLAAASGGATHLITGDQRHFGSYFGRKVMGVVVMTPGQYLAGRQAG